MNRYTIHFDLHRDHCTNQMCTPKTGLLLYILKPRKVKVPKVVLDGIHGPLYILYTLRLLPSGSRGDTYKIFSRENKNIYSYTVSRPSNFQLSPDFHQLLSKFNWSWH